MPLCSRPSLIEWRKLMGMMMISWWKLLTYDERPSWWHHSLSLGGALRGVFMPLQLCSTHCNPVFRGLSMAPMCDLLSSQGVSVVVCCG